jgi:hypothetical protein
MALAAPGTDEDDRILAEIQRERKVERRLQVDDL